MHQHALLHTVETRPSLQITGEPAKVRMALQHISAQLKSNPPRHFSQVSPSQCWDNCSCVPVQARPGVVAVLTACAVHQHHCAALRQAALCLLRVCPGEAEAPIPCRCQPLRH